VKIHGLDTNWRPLEHEILCKCLKAKKVILNTISLGVGGPINTSPNLNHQKELGLGKQKAHETALKLLCASDPSVSFLLIDVGGVSPPT